MSIWDTSLATSPCSAKANFNTNWTAEARTKRPDSKTLISTSAILSWSISLAGARFSWVLPLTSRWAMVTHRTKIHCTTWIWIRTSICTPFAPLEIFCNTMTVTNRSQRLALGQLFHPPLIVHLIASHSMVTFSTPRLMALMVWWRHTRIHWSMWTCMVQLTLHL